MPAALKPCPFCGKSGLVYALDSRGNWKMAMYVSESEDYEIRCIDDKECATIGPFGETKDEAVKRWNTRCN